MSKDDKKVNRVGITGLSKRDKRSLAILIGIGIAAIVVLVVVVVLLGERAGEEAAPQQTVEVEAEAEEPVVETHEGEAISPLTGTYIKEGWVTKRPVALMIENTTMSLPQYGLNSCGVIYECPVEGGITRLMGISDAYHKLKQFGNVRSCRPYYVYLAAEYDAIYCHVGQSVHGQEVLNTGIVDDLNAMDGDISNTVFYRTSDKKAPHNCFTSGKAIDEGIKTKDYRKKYDEGYRPHFSFIDEDEEAIPDGEDAAVVCPYFLNNKPYFVYNKKTGTYDRYQFGDKQIDAIDNKQVSVKNIIYQTSASNTSLYSGTDYVNIPLVGDGEGMFFSGGKAAKITWEKESDTAQTKFYYEDGSEIELAPGQTWICLIEKQYMDKNSYYATVKDYDNRAQ